MRNIRKFETFEDFLASQESVSGSGKYVLDIVPGFAYVKERYEDGTYAFYNGVESEEYEFGDIIYYDGTPKLKKVYYSAFTPSMGEKVGLVVVPTALSPDGNARIMAFGSITTENQSSSEEPVYYASKPESKDTLLGASTSYSIVSTVWYGNMADENQTVYTCVPGFYLSGGSSPQEGTLAASAPGSEGQTSHYELPLYLSDSSRASKFSSDANFMYPNPHTNGEYYNTANTSVAISPFLGDSLKEQDPAYLQEELAGAPGPLGGWNYNAFSDFSGYTWTYGCPPEYNGGGGKKLASPSLKSSKPVSGILGAYFPHDYVRQFYTDGTQQGDWYLPSMGEMGFVVARYKKINEIFNYLYSVGAIAEDGTDNIPGYDALDALSPSIWTSTVGAKIGGSNVSRSETTMAASIPGDNTKPTVGPVYVYVETPAQETTGHDLDLERNVLFVLDSGDGGAPQSEVLPFAMINDGKIQRTMGDYTLANGHQMKDFYRPVITG